MALDGLINQSASVLIKYRVDTSEAKAGLKSLSGAEKQAAQERIAALEAGNKKIDDQAKGWKKVAGTIAVAAGSVALAKAGLDAYGKTSAENAEKVKKITGAVGGAMDKLLSGIGSVVVAFGPVIEAVGEMVGLLGDAVSLVGDIVQAATQGEGVIDRMVKLSPEVQKYLKDHSVEGIKRRAAEAENAGKPTVGGVFGGTVALGATIQARAAMPTGQNGLMRIGGMLYAPLKRGYGLASAIGNDPWSLGSDEIEMDAMDVRRTPGTAPKMGSHSTAKYTDPLVAQLEREIAEERARVSAAETSAMLRNAAAGFGTDPNVGGALDKFYADGGEMQKRVAESYQQHQGNKTASFMESTFGPVDQFDAYAGGFDLIESAATSAFDAMWDGSISVGEAIKKSTGALLKAKASEMMIESLKNAAYGTAALAIGGPFAGKTAGQYFAASAMFAIGATAAGAAASGLGAYGGGGSAGGARAPSPGGGGGGGSGSGQPERIIIYGDNFAEETARNRSIRAQKMVDRAYSSSATENW